MQLAAHNFDRAREYVLSQARSLDQALFRFYFETGSAAAVHEQLKAFQNEDGGFGQALEPDFRMPHSSPLATTVAFQYLQQTGADPQDELVQAGIRYLLASYDPEKRTWQAVSEQVEAYPHAPWWQASLARQEPLVDAQGAALHYQPNPSAEIVGYLHAYARHAPASLLRQLSDQALEYLQLVDDPIENHDLLCYLRLTENLPQPWKQVVNAELLRRAGLTISVRPEEWQAGYVLKPHVFVPAPQAILASALGEAARLSLEYEISKQEPDGYWGPGWTWGQYEQIWSIAEIEWRGYLTVQLLRKFQLYGMLEQRS